MPENTNQETVVITVPRGPINEPQTFDTADNFKNWCRQQISFIESMELPSGYLKPDIKIDADAKVVGLLDRLKLPYEVALAILKSPEPVSADFDKAQAELERYVQSGLFVRRSEVGNAFAIISHPWTRVGFLSRLCFVSVSDLAYPGPKELDDVFRGYWAAASLPGVQLVQRNGQVTTYETVVDRASELIDRSESLIAEKSGELANVAKEFQDAMEGISLEIGKAKESLQNLENNQDAILKSYQDKIATDEAREYWERKYQDHKNALDVARSTFRRHSVQGSIVVFLIISIGVILGLVLRHYFSEDAVGQLVRFLAGLPIGWSVASAGLVFLPLFLFIWHLRTLMAGANMHQQLAEDAKLRSTIVTVYLSLASRETNAATSEERALLLNALFRPIDGRKSDESMPPGLVEFVTRSKP